MNCQHCQAELTSKRAKQCPDCAEIKNNAHRYGTYGTVVEALETAKANGLTGQAVRDFALGKRQEATQENNKEADEFRTERAARVARVTERANRRDVCPGCGWALGHDRWCEFAG